MSFFRNVKRFHFENNRSPILNRVFLDYKKSKKRLEKLKKMIIMILSKKVLFFTNHKMTKKEKMVSLQKIIDKFQYEVEKHREYEKTAKSEKEMAFELGMIKGFQEAISNIEYLTRTGCI